MAAEENRKRRERTVQGKLTAIGRAAVLVSLYEGARTGKGCHALAEDLNERGVPAARGGTWTAARVYDLITSTAARRLLRAARRRFLRGVRRRVRLVVDRQPTTRF